KGGAEGLDARQFERAGTGGGLGFGRDQDGPGKVGPKPRQDIEVVMFARSHFADHELAKRAFGKKALEPRRNEAVQSDLVPALREPVACALFGLRIVPAE